MLAEVVSTKSLLISSMIASITLDENSGCSEISCPFALAALFRIPQMMSSFLCSIFSPRCSRSRWAWLDCSELKTALMRDLVVYSLSMVSSSWLCRRWGAELTSAMLQLHSEQIVGAMKSRTESSHVWSRCSLVDPDCCCCWGRRFVTDNSSQDGSRTVFLSKLLHRVWLKKHLSRLPTLEKLPCVNRHM